MRLLIYLSRTGACSRRKALDFIKLGRVSVNAKKVTEPSFSVCDTDQITLDGKPVILKKHVYVLLNKPKGVVTSVADKFAEKTVLDFMPKNLKYLFPVGRLDKDTTGLLLLTNDGDLSYRLMHPSFEVDKIYEVVLDKKLLPCDKDILEKGVMLEGKKTAPCVISKSGVLKLEITIHEGRKRQIRRMFSARGYKVVDLCRLRQGPLSLKGLKVGSWRFLEQKEVAQLYHLIGLKRVLSA
ncbi:MAG: pseudouridine synthase [Candidatus Omnitrophota bacterium]